MTNSAIRMNELKETAQNNRERNAENKRANRAKEAQAKRDYRQKDRHKNADTIMKGADAVAKIGSAVFKSIGNDHSFYTKGQEELVQKIVPTNVLTPMGNAVKVDGSTIGYTNAAKAGIFAHYYVNSIGWATRASDPVNKAAFGLFTAIQRNTNYTKDYQSSDLMLMILQQRELVTLTHHIAKIFRLAQSNPVMNRYTPKNLVEANLANYDDLILNMADYKIRFQLLLNASKQLKIVNIPLMTRAAQLAGSTYWDEDDESQSAIHTFVPIAYGSIAYNENDAVIREKMVFNPTTSVYSAEDIRYNELPFMTDWLDKLEELINLLLADSTFKFIVGDIERTFTDFFTLTDVTVDAAQEHSHDPFMLNQISNMTYAPINVDTYTIDQDTSGAGFLMSTPKFVEYGVDSWPLTAGNEEFRSLVDLHDNMEASANNIIDVTRLQPVWFPHATPDTYVGKVTWGVNCGTEIPVAGRVYMYREDKNQEPHQLFTLARWFSPLTSTPFYTAVNVMRFVASINHRPAMFFYEVPEGQNYAKQGILRLANFDRVRTYSNSSFEYMNELAMYSLFGLTSLL